MARVLFIVNEHPNEAFAISVARETAKLVRAAGHTVAWRKVPREATYLGVILDADRALSHEDVVRRKKTAEVVEGFHKEVKPELTYKFHCTPHDELLWRKSYKRAKADFSIRGGRRKDGTHSYTVEMKAVYKPFPKRLDDRITSKTDGWAIRRASYLEKTTSQSKTRELGLDPEKFAERIAKVILKENIPKRREIFRRRGRIKKKKPLLKRWRK